MLRSSNIYDIHLHIISLMVPHTNSGRHMFDINLMHPSKANYIDMMLSEMLAPEL